MATKKPKLVAELGLIYKDKKQSRFVRVTHVGAEKVDLVDVDTGRLSVVSPATFAKGYEATPTEAAKAAGALTPEPAPAPVTPIAAGQRYRYHDYHEDVIEILGPGAFGGTWMAHEILNDKKTLFKEADIRASWLLIVDEKTAAAESIIKPGQVWTSEENPTQKVRIVELSKAGEWVVRASTSDFDEVMTATRILKDLDLEKDVEPEKSADLPVELATPEEVELKIAAERTPDPADPPLPAGIAPLEEVLEAESDADAENEEDALLVTDKNERAMIALMRGELRDLGVEYKTKELRVELPSHRKLVFVADDLQDLVNQLAQEILLHWSQVSSNPKPGEIPVKSRLPARGGVLATKVPAKLPEVPKVDAAPAPAPAPAAPVNGTQAPEPPSPVVA